MNEVTKEWLKYFNDFLKEDYDTEDITLDNLSDEIGDYVCKYAEDQDEVNLILDEIDEEMLKTYPDWV